MSRSGRRSPRSWRISLRSERVTLNRTPAELERISLRAWPAFEEVERAGWILRAAEGYTRRANSCQPLGPLPDDADRDDAIADAREWYRTRGLRPVFKITDATEPADLDSRLDAAGWAHEAPTTVMVRDLGPAPALAFPAEPAPGPPDLEWLQAFSAWAQLPADRAGSHREILRRIRPTRTYARILEAGRPVAVGLAVLDEAWVGLFDLVTDPGLRSRGYGTRLVKGILDWAVEQGAEAAYLQVMESNPRARDLYGHLGFRAAYSYWYRVAPEGP